MQCIERMYESIMDVIFAMLPSKGNHTLIPFKGKCKSSRLIKQLLYMLCDIIYKIMNILSLIRSLTVAQV